MVFESASSVPKALALSGQTVDGAPAYVVVTHSEKTRQIFGGAGALTTGRLTRLHVSKIHPDISEEDLHQLFSPFGDLSLVQLSRQPTTGQPIGFGNVHPLGKEINFLKKKKKKKRSRVSSEEPPVLVAAIIQFENPEDAKNAQEKMNGFVLAEKALLIVLVGEPLRESSLTETKASTPTVAVPPPVAPTRCIVLQNMFDPTQEEGNSWPEEIKEEVSEECSNFGQVLHCRVIKDSKVLLSLFFPSALGLEGS